MSRQYDYQLRQQAKGLCRLCPKARGKSSMYCALHLKRYRLRPDSRQVVSRGAKAVPVDHRWTRKVDI